jgi:hypothetical protein
MATLEFAPLSAPEADAWLAQRGTEQKLGHPATIAELHAILAGGKSKPPPRRGPLGFE